MNKVITNIANNQLQLVWQRYNVMIVVHAILMGFIGQLAWSWKDKTDLVLGISGCLIGLILVILWLIMTSAGWSISHAYVNASINQFTEIYSKWKDNTIKIRGKDLIWWSAHAVIMVFYFAYLALGFYFGFKLAFGIKSLIAISIVPLFMFIGIFIFCSMIFTLDDLNNKEQ